MGFYSSMDVDLQDLQDAHEAAAQDVHDACLGGMSTQQWMPAFRANLGERLAELGWIAPTITDVLKRRVNTALSADDPAERENAIVGIATLLGVDVDADITEEA